MVVLTTLGTALIDAAGLRLTPNSARKFALMLYLAAQPGRRLSRATLQDLVYPDIEWKRGHHALRQLLYLFRRAGVPIEGGRHSVELASSDVRADYRDLIQADRPTIAQLKAAEGGFLTDYSPIPSEGFTEWLDGYRARVSFDLSKALVAEMTRARRGGDWATTERAARACLAIEPLNEESTLALAEMFAIGGSKAKALALLDRHIKEVGKSPDLKLSASVLRRRISERFPGVRSARTPSPFIGRESEMQIMTERFELTLGGRPQCVIVGGEPGIGKTRLASEFSHLASLRGANVVRMVAQPHDTYRPLGAFVDLTPLLLELPGALGCSPNAMDALGRLTTHDADFNLPLPSSPEMEALEFAISRSVIDLIDAVAAEKPLVLLLEDAHWLDRPSQHLLGTLISNAQSRQLLLVMTTREPRAAAKMFRETETLGVIALPGLSGEASRELASWALGTAASARRPELPDRLVSTSAGNPFFLISLGWHNQASDRDVEIPESLRALVASRLATLDHRAVSLLQTCAAFGKHATVERLIAALEIPYIELLSTLTALSDQRMVDDEQGEVRLAHPLLIEALHEETSGVVRRVTAHRVAGILQADADRLRSASLLWDCAEQWREAGDYERALSAMRACSRHSIDMGRPLEAAKVLKAATELPAGIDGRIAAARELVQVADAAADYGLVIAGAEIRAALGAPAIHDEVEIAEMGARFRMQPENIERERRAIACVCSRDASPEHRVQTAITILKYADSSARLDLIQRLEAAFDAADLGAVDEATRLEFLLVWHTCRDHAAAALDVATRLREIANGLPEHRRLSLLRSVYIGLWRCGADVAARKVLEECYELGQRLGMTRVRFRAEFLMVSICDSALEATEADAWFARATRTAEMSPELLDDPEWALERLDALLNRRRFDEASLVLCEAVDRNLLAGGYRARVRRALELRIRQGRRAYLAEDTSLARQLPREAGPYSGGLRDWEIGVSCMVLADHGAADEAREILMQYFQEERGQLAPFARVLRHACDALACLPRESSGALALC